MLNRETPRALARNGTRGYCSERSWMYAVLEPTRHAYAVWGVPDEAEVSALLTLFDDTYGKFQPHSILADLSDLETVNLAPFTLFRRYFDTRSVELAAMVTHACVMVAESLAGSAAAGFLGIVRAPFEFTTTKQVAEAANRLGWATADLQSYLHTKSIAMGTRSLLTQVQAALTGQLAVATSATVARALGVSERSMQRALHACATSFSQQLLDARVQAAQALLTESSLSIIRIALDVGFRSPEHFATVFRQKTGKTPSAYRKATAT
jgi:AraC-like DNA-binding protein